MGLLSHLTHPKGKIWIALDKGTFQEGEPVVGKIHVEAEEYIPSIGLKVEARVVESWNEMVWVTLPNNQRIQENQRRTNNLYQRDVQVTGATDFGGYSSLQSDKGWIFRPELIEGGLAGQGKT